MINYGGQTTAQIGRKIVGPTGRQSETRQLDLIDELENHNPNNLNMNIISPLSMQEMIEEVK